MDAAVKDASFVRPESGVSYSQTKKAAEAAKAAYEAALQAGDAALIAEKAAAWYKAADTWSDRAIDERKSKKERDTSRGMFLDAMGARTLSNKVASAPTESEGAAPGPTPEPAATPTPKKNFFESFGAKAKSISERIKNANWEKAAQVLGGAAVGFAVKNSLRAAATATGGYAYAAAFGAIAGGTVAMTKELISRYAEETKFEKFEKEFLNDFNSTLDPEELAVAKEKGYKHEDLAKFWSEKRTALTAELGAATNEASREVVRKKLNQLHVFLNRWTAKNDDYLRDLIAEITKLTVTASESPDESAQDALWDEIVVSKLHKRKILVAVGKGALYGALGGVLGAGAADLAEAFEHGGFSGILTKAGGALEQAKASVTSWTQGWGGGFSTEEVHAAGADVSGASESVQTNTPEIARADSAQLSNEDVPATDTVAAPVQSQEVVLTLEEGSNPWSTVRGMLREQGILHPTNAQMLEIMKQVAHDSHIGVSEWGVTGEGWPDDQELPVGFQLTISPNTQELINRIGASTRH